MTNTASAYQPWNSGIPSIKEYEHLLNTPDFKSMEIFSDRFLASNAKALKSYREKWVSDPLHQWSRQWEYPYTQAKILEFASSSDGLKILDAGSGVTFFPWLLAEALPNSTISCCDRDAELGEIFDEINRQSDRQVNFSRSDLHALPFEDNSLDVIYCISVLEHTDDHRSILDEFKRVLRPNGLLIITFDISLDGERDIPPSQAESLLGDMVSKFNTGENPELMAAITDPTAITTAYFKKKDPSLLPWRKPSQLAQIKHVVRGKGHGWPPLLSFYCLTLRS